MAGYSATPLLQKLGYKASDTVMVYAAPVWFRELLAKNDVVAHTSLPATHAHLFVATRAELLHLVTPTFLKKITSSLWVSWPKKASGVTTDVTEQTLRDIILPLGWVDSKVCAVDDTWSGLKFTRRRV